MKTKKLCIILISILFITSSFLSAQIARRIESVAGKAVKTKVWKGKEIQFAAKEIAVKISPSATQTEINDLLKSVEGKIINSFDKLGWGLIELPATKDEILAIDDLSKLPFVSVAEPNMVTSTTLEPNDPYFNGTSPATYPYQWALKNTGQTPPTGTNDADIDANDAWNISTGNADVIIAILDTGIPMLNGSLSHPDLDDPNKIILGPDYTNNGNGVKDLYGHGTHVAGITAAESNNGTGIAGVAWNCKIMVIQVFDDYGSGYFSYFYNGVVYAVDYQRNNPTKKVVINYSGGGGANQQALDAVIYANTYGVPIIASAGNEYGGSVLYPAAYSSSYSNVVAVSSTDATDTFSPFSSQGSQVCVSAPGGYGGYWDGYVYRYNGQSVLGKNIFSTTPNYTFNIAIDPVYAGDPYSTDVTQNYGYMPGTSMSAPHVTGIAGLLLSVNPNLTPSQIRNIIQQTAEDKGTTGFDNYYGYGRINAYKAIKYALEHYGGTLTQNLVIPSGEIWYFQPGVTVSFTSGTSLIVNGILNAVGTSSNRITFNFSGSSGFWGGIQVNNSSYSYIQFCNINNASTGVYLNNNSNRTMVSDCQINNSDYYGIYVYNSQPTILRNRIVNQPNTGAFGIFCNYYGLPFTKDNLIKGFGTSGIYCVDHSGAFWTNSTANNVIKENYHGLYSNYYSNIYLGNTSNNGFNSIYSNSVYDVKALDYSTSYVQNNWWGVYPPNATKFYNDASSAIIRSNPLSSDPNSGLFMIASNDNGRINADISLSTSIANNSLEYSIATSDDFSNEINLLLDLFKKNSKDKAGRNSLISLEYLFTKSGRKDFMDFSKKELRPFIKESDELYPLILELEMHQLLNSGDIKQALNYNDILEVKINDKTVNKYALFRKGFLYLTQMNDAKSAKEVFIDFINKYPKDELVYVINNLLNNNGVDNPQFALQKEEKNGLLNKEELLTEFNLENCYPNPFNPTTKISFAIPEKSQIKLRVFDVLGREVSLLADGVYEAGKYQITFDAGNLPSGVYFYNLTTGSNSISKKMLLVK